MKYLVIAISLFLMVGCKSIEPKEVLIPVYKNCSDKPIPSKPLLCVDKLTGDEKIDNALNCALSDVNELELYSEKLEVFICK